MAICSGAAEAEGTWGGNRAEIADALAADGTAMSSPCLATGLRRGAPTRLVGVHSCSDPAGQTWPGAYQGDRERDTYDCRSAGSGCMSGHTGGSRQSSNAACRDACGMRAGWCTCAGTCHGALRSVALPAALMIGHHEQAHDLRACSAAPWR